MAEIRYVGEIKRLTKVKSEVLNVKTVIQLLQKIENRHGKEAYYMAKRSHIIVNHESITEQSGLRRSLSDEDVVHIVPVCGGG